MLLLMLLLSLLILLLIYLRKGNICSSQQSVLLSELLLCQIVYKFNEISLQDPLFILSQSIHGRKYVWREWERKREGTKESTFIRIQFNAVYLGVFPRSLALSLSSSHTTDESHYSLHTLRCEFSCISKGIIVHLQWNPN